MNIHSIAEFKQAVSHPGVECVLFQTREGEAPAEPSVYLKEFLITRVASHSLGPEGRQSIAPAVRPGVIIRIFPSQARRADTWRLLDEFQPVRTHSMPQLLTYWIATALTAFVFLSGGVVDIVRPNFAVEGMTLLGYPTYFMVILGVWKVLGGAVILAQNCRY